MLEKEKTKEKVRKKEVIENEEIVFSCLVVERKEVMENENMEGNKYEFLTESFPLFGWWKKNWGKNFTIWQYTF